MFWWKVWEMRIRQARRLSVLEFQLSQPRALVETTEL